MWIGAFARVAQTYGRNTVPRSGAWVVGGCRMALWKRLQGSRRTQSLHLSVRRSHSGLCRDVDCGAGVGAIGVAEDRVDGGRVADWRDNVRIWDKSTLALQKVLDAAPPKSAPSHEGA